MDTADLSPIRSSLHAQGLRLAQQKEQLASLSTGLKDIATQHKSTMQELGTHFILLRESLVTRGPAASVVLDGTPSDSSLHTPLQTDSCYPAHHSYLARSAVSPTFSLQWRIR